MTQTKPFLVQAKANPPKASMIEPQVKATRRFIRLPDGRAVPTKVVESILSRIREWKIDGYGAALSTRIRGQVPGLSLDDVLYLIVTHDEQTERELHTRMLGLRNAIEIANDAAAAVWSLEAA